MCKYRHAPVQTASCRVHLAQGKQWINFCAVIKLMWASLTSVVFDFSDSVLPFCASSVQMAAQVDTLVDEGQVERAAPIMQAAADKILAGRHKWFVWTSGGSLTCPLAAPLRTCGSQPAIPSVAQSARVCPSNSPGDDGCIDLASDDSPGRIESPGDKSGHQQTDEADAPLFLARFDAAWIYGELATMHVSYLEKKRQYNEACTLLRALLGGSACPLRRCASRYCGA
jgi:hypothetical protein